MAVSGGFALAAILQYLFGSRSLSTYFTPQLQQFILTTADAQ
jgi:hypothetical protein